MYFLCFYKKIWEVLLISDIVIILIKYMII